MAQKELLLNPVYKVISVVSVNNEDTIIDIWNSTCISLLI